MKKLFFLLSFLLLFVPLAEVNAKEIVCPNLNELKKTTAEDREELLQALEKLIPSTYGQEEEASLFSKWKILTAIPFPQTSGKDHVYYEMAQNFCGREIADRSWLVRISFPKWEGKSASMSEGQIFVAKRKDDEWFVWFRYH